MTASSLTLGARVRLAAADFQTLLDALAGRGYQVMGPSLEDGRLVYGEIGKVTDLPVGWTAIQAGGTFRLSPRPDRAFFGYAVGQQSWKQFLLPPHQTLYQAQREGAGFHVIPGGQAVPKFAFVGVRPVNWWPWQCRTGFFCRAPMSIPPTKPGGSRPLS
jgi:hypothetical protein